MKLKRQAKILIGGVILVSTATFIFFLMRSPVLDKVVVEAGAKKVTVEQFMRDHQDHATLKTNINEDMMSKVGDYDIVIDIDGEEYKSKLCIEDTIAPQAVSQNVSLYQNQDINPEMFIKEIIDKTKVDVSFQKDVTTKDIGEFDVVIVLEDEGHNKTEIKGKLTVKKDDIPPKIDGLKNMSVEIGKTVSYKKGITVSDNLDKDIELKIDSSKVNLNHVGKYPVVYSATDKAGNTTQKTIYINVILENKKIVSIDDLYARADSVLSQIINDSMTKRQKCKKIFDWVHSHVYYINDSDKSSWTSAAMYAFNNQKGDCFNYFAITKVLLTRAGIENIDLKATKHTHFWNFVKVEEGWYHLDTTPRYDHPNLFLKTDAWIDAYSKKHGNCFSYAPGSKPASAKK